MEIIERAPAKINLGLDVLHKRVDGYHEVESIFASVDLADHLTFENLEEDIIRIETDSSFLPVDRRNHVYQAVDLLKRTYNIHKGIKIYIEKRIPVAAGLAGGSSDCAAALRGLNKLWNLGLTMDELCEIGSQIGMDVPYCLRGGTAFADGRGEKIEALPTMPQCWIVLVKPRISVSTSTVFNDLAVDELHHPDIAGLRIAIENGDYTGMTQTVGNALESVTIARHPIVQQIKDRMLKYGADAALMSGSGPTVFALCEKKTRAQRIYNGLKGFCEEVYLVRTLK
ncbi:4-(cytidine 5'-diphospho)-2-C-methyl-D-erythritol kinase [Enterococcus faecalis]|uniref:4-(cytidine 5'-diphospho)-2-C-methyl-D-erythritol kinase n=1 Tax=Enterococcus faecalis TaxID=1351 RepID=UPI000813C362|nr:4-(cytidine 5'-diphospho)-2-C-methyl-D-erythritol kinase [Enterococcus faecalis]EGO5143812.1 4-(cytidine 5'-diphospho)-2-C-methyl-D-erythritol kinase [Enterococcus faecalis]EGO5856708.1 4-(cytidine 5'-diphospho)-2-C-methyl-D-erythritol kinase [Enterococcus faecalis]EGO7502675.1 4-(cytidine 5'-diphospho)-2-C-methyl-D-erythritol kinase [Enterococcus faecalis]EGO7837963.1 4-(cytidine 5'-diphospho)-2-C-methyl-D-erythritol kinase [Enterococcus faecalis]EGO7997596.1 4-(cytidine 5'-diphospho)-2-C-